MGGNGKKKISDKAALNIAIPLVDWRKIETALFVWQISHQVGPFLHGSELRVSHHKGLEDEFLVRQLLHEMTKSRNRKKKTGNRFRQWQHNGSVVFAYLWYCHPTLS